MRNGVMRWCCGGDSARLPATQLSNLPTSTIGDANRAPNRRDIPDAEMIETPLLHNPSPNHRPQFDRWGPMLLRPNKTALLICLGNNGPDCPFVSRLKNSDWTVQTIGITEATTELQRLKPAVVLLDHKISDISALISSLRNLNESEDILFALLIDRIPTEKKLRSLSKAEIPQFFLYSNTDTSLCEQFGRLTSRLRAIPALFAVVEEAEQPIKICDEKNVVQYVNRAYEIVTGRSRSDVLGTDASEMRLKVLNGAPVAVDSAAQLPPPAPPTVTPIAETENLCPQSGGGSFSGTSSLPPTQANRRRSSEWHCITVPSSSQGPQFVYVKRGSADAAIARDLSLKSLRSNSALVDAPITEALNVLSNVIHKCDEDTQSQVRDAIKMLSVTELYAPSITRFRDTDRIASGYYDGLIRLHHPPRQRKRSVVDAFRENQRRQSIGEARRRISSDVVNALETENTWHFDVIELERVTDHHPLAHLGIKIFDRWNVGETLRCGADTIGRWLTLIEANYQSINSYHNATHAADVLQATSFFLNAETVAQCVQDTHAVAALIAAAVHDLDHPGRGNAFLMNTRQRLALLYNDQSVLENHHVALAFQLTLAQPGVNIFARTPREEFVNIRQAVIDMVLATDMSKHFEYLTKFQHFVVNISDSDDNREANSLTVCRMMIKCADIANPTRDWKLCHEWAMRIVEEYFEQTSEEAEKGLPVTMKGFDRETCNVPMTQRTFVDMFARETFTVWCEFADLPLLLVQLESNYGKWREMSEPGQWDPTKNANIRSNR